jgi:hypothetical protein
MTELEENPAPMSTACSACHEEDSLLVAVDVCHYYRVTEIDEGRVEGASTGSTEVVEIRLFCSQCGEYFEVPDHYELIG